MKKIWLLILVILLAVALLGGALIYVLVAVPKLTTQSDEPTMPDFISVEEYIGKEWTEYRFVSLEDGVLTLEYDLTGSFEQLQKHGLAAGYDAVAAGNLESGSLMIHGCNMQCNVILKELVVCGISSDGKEVYRASSVSGVTACWDEE